MINALAALQSSLAAQQQSASSSKNHGNSGGYYTIDAKSVRSAIEKDALLQAQEFEGQLRQLVGEATRLRERVDRVKESAQGLISGDEMDQKDDKNSKQIVQELNEALKVRDEAKKRMTSVSGFLERFEVNPDDAKLLEGFDFSQVTINMNENIEETKHESDKGMSQKVEDFLDALDKVHSVRLELSRVFKSGEPGVGTTSAIRMMESLGSKQELGYEKLYKWLQSFLGLDEFQKKSASVLNDRFDEALSHTTVQRALRTLKNAPSFHRHTLELISSLRRSEITRRFLLALTQGYNGVPPIEMKAHDPQSYVGEMLAFVHQSLSMEKEIVCGLIDKNTSDEYELNTEYSLMDDDMIALKPMSSLDILCNAFEGVSRPLKSRISQVVASLSRRNQDDQSSDTDEEEQLRKSISELYIICGLIIFYHSATVKVMNKVTQNENKVDEETPLLEVLTQCLTEAANAYTASVKVYGSQLDSFEDKDQVELASSLLSFISDIRLSSPGFDTEVSLTENITNILSLNFICNTVIDPCITSCSSLENTELLKTSILSARTSGLAIKIADSTLEAIEDKEKKIIADMVQIETKKFLSECGLGDIQESYSKRNLFPNNSLSDCPGLDSDTIQRSFDVFYASLYSPPLSTFERIKDHDKRRQARQQVVASVAKFYETIYEEVTDESAGYNDTSFLGHNPNQVKMLLSL